MKKFLSIFFVFSFLMTGAASAQTGMIGYPTENKSTIVLPDQTALRAAMQEIFQSQHVSDQKQVNCAKVTDLQLIKLGDAAMGYGITEEDHTAMENMMGGEDAPMSKQAHLNMGRSYLGCWANYNSGPMVMPMMNSAYERSSSSLDTRGANSLGGTQGMMGQNIGTSWGMMCCSYGFGEITIILIWTLLILGIIALVKWLKKN